MAQRQLGGIDPALVAVGGVEGIQPGGCGEIKGIVSCDDLDFLGDAINLKKEDLQYGQNE